MRPGYSLALSAFALLCWLAFLLTFRPLKKKAPASLLFLILGPVLGILFGKALYLIVRIVSVLVEGGGLMLDPSWLPIEAEQMTFYGTGAGICVAVAVSCRCFGIAPKEGLDHFAVFGAIYLGLARCCSLVLSQDMIGLGMQLEEPERLPAFLTYVNEWSEGYLRVFLLEALAAFIIAGCSFAFFRKDRFVRTLFWICLAQVLLENLHSDSLTWFFFLRVEQLLCAITVLVLLIRSGVRLKKAWPTVAGVAGIGLLVFVIWAMDKSDLPMGLLYGLMAAALAGMGVAECLCARLTRKTANT